MSLTIAVVTYNCENLLGATLSSISAFRNKWPGDIEIIAIDGGSIDSTLSILKNSNLFDSLVSEKDNGIFDAMNKAANTAAGDWICFMNAGDFFVDIEAQNLYNELSIKCVDVSVLYGDTYVVFDGETKYLKKCTSVPTLFEPMPFCHQSVFTRTELLKKFPFDPEYPRVADQKLYMEILTSGYKFKYFPEAISTVVAEGFSSSQMNKTISEQINLKLEFHLITKADAIRVKFRMLAIQFIKNLSPKWALKLKRRFFGV
ncbi:glycosyltransferase [Shewanella sp. JM162201]|uniref:Glycosyltransferase n=1 Tax=Shewanella jiangmenensis TaxID=2837387 RepID=A0ABS5UY42_9GAMM|nr:glycosyltransferase [Shewanella jiangmenensis]MBT1443001.1 glycosyltransferase [Shewanella jiangmenensis]